MQTFMLILLLSCIMSSQSIFMRLYNRKLKVSVENSVLLTLAQFSILTIIYLILCRAHPAWHIPTFAYAVCYGVMVAANYISTSIAITTGPYALTNLLVTFSLVISVLFGIFYLHETITVAMVAGIVLLCTSLCLLYEKSPAGSKLTLPWLIAVVAAFFCNAGCSISQKLHQTDYPGQYQNEFMFYGGFLATLSCMLFYLIKKIRWIQAKAAFSKGWPAMLCLGLACTGVNLLIMFMHTRTSSALLFPTLSGLNLMIAALLSRFAYHEKMTSRQKWSFCIGVCSLVLMNL